MLDLAGAVRRAAARVPGPIAERSLEALSALRFSARLLDVPIGDPDPHLGLLRVAPGERWCKRCGDTINEHGNCWRCGANRWRPAVEVLRPDEYFVAR